MKNYQNLKSFCPRHYVNTKKKRPKIIQRSNDDHSQIIGGDISPISPGFGTTDLANIKKISIFDDTPHPLRIETNIAGYFDLTAQINN